jgi:cysteine-rich repeat protein
MRSSSLLLVCALASACVSSNAVTCGDGSLCPQGTSCHQITTPPVESICATPAQVAACDGMPDHTQCAAAGIMMGRCYDGVCIDGTCGNGRVDAPDPSDPTDKGEVCDDGNQRDGDGCSANCLSTEVCGNGVTDFVKQEACDDGNLIDHDGCDSRCQPETPSWTIADQLEPSYRLQAAMTFEGTSGRVIMFGGSDITTGQYLNDTWLWDGHGWQRAEPPGSPEPRQGAALAYDPDRHVVVLYGGEGNSGSTGDTWEWNGARWTTVFTLHSPGARAGAAMVYDTKRKRMVLVGGRAIPAPTAGNIVSVPYDFSSAWTFDGTDWTELMTASPPPPQANPASTCHLTLYNEPCGRSYAAATYDAKRGKIVVFGGSTIYYAGLNRVIEVVADDHVWELGDDWTDVTPPAPIAARELAAMAFDPATGKSILYGGTAAPNQYTDTESWDGATWTQLSAGAATDQRRDHAMVTDVARAKIIALGGEQADPDPANWNLSTIQWDGTSWASVPTVTPVGMTASTAHDTDRGVTVLIDGSGMTWELDDVGWHATGVPVPDDGAPSAGLSPVSACYDAATKHTLVFGYNLATTPAPITALWDGTVWTEDTPAQSPPSFNYGHQLVCDDARGEALLFGTSSPNGTDMVNDQWTWKNHVWTHVTPAHMPPARSYPQLAYDPVHRLVIMFGGGVGTGDDMWSWDGTDWTEVSVTGTKPPGRQGASFGWLPSRQRMILVGGQTIGGGSQATWEWDGSKWTWLAVEPGPGFPSAVPVWSRDGASLLAFSNAFFSFTAPIVTWRLHWQGAGASEMCTDNVDLDGDTLKGCKDPDCWWACTPDCPPGATMCTGPTCGDGAAAPLETCHACSQDVTCTPECGDFYCDGSEAQTCPGDCP